MKEIEFFNRNKNKESKIKIVVSVVGVLLFGGVVLDSMNRFYIIRSAKSFGWALGGILLLSIFYLIGEVGCEWISSKDNVSHPLYKRFFHLVLLFGFVGIIVYCAILVFKYIGW